MRPKSMPNGFTQKQSVLLRVPGGDVAGHALVEPVAGEDPERGGEALLAVAALVLDGRAPGVRERPSARGLDGRHHRQAPRRRRDRGARTAERLFSLARCGALGSRMVRFLTRLFSLDPTADRGASVAAACPTTSPPGPGSARPRSGSSRRRASTATSLRAIAEDAGTSPRSSCTTSGRRTGSCARSTTPRSQRSAPTLDDVPTDQPPDAISADFGAVFERVIGGDPVMRAYLRRALLQDEPASTALLDEMLDVDPLRARDARPRPAVSAARQRPAVAAVPGAVHRARLDAARAAAAARARRSRVRPRRRRAAAAPPTSTSSPTAC